MAEYKHQMNKHLDSAKEWVERAQHSFEEKKDIRGELDLFLAQAELAHAKKTSRLHRLTQYSFFKESVALLVAFFLAAAGLGAGYWLNFSLPENQLETQQPPSPPKTAEPFAGQPPQLNDWPDKISRAQPNQAPAAAARAAETVLEEPVDVSLTETSVPEQTPAPVSREEMRNLIRSAGTSLRTGE
ncbi:MAG: hypothetical protein LBR56_08115 [Sporomusaceae bacterium]|jgi:hypothetical protein|nr:hypothetical protein [Sporomusaceae bacterium]